MGKSKSIQSPRGMHDILPDDQKYWQFILKNAIKLSEEYGFKRIDTPILESTDLFTRSVGEGTDIIEKEMYSFRTKGGDRLSLRPEGTSPIARAYVEHGMNSLPQPVKLYYFGPMFRHEKPQAGRFRQHYQFGLEMLGEKGAASDAMLILIASTFLKGVGVKNINVKINSIGDRHCRPDYIKALKGYLRSRIKKLCAQCKNRIKINVLRILDCKDKGCREALSNAPQIIDYLDQNCKNHFKSVLEFLDEVEIPYLIDPFLVRGLDYYTRTVFEIFPEEDKEEKSAALISGGRYDRLVRMIGGSETPASGWAAGIERIILDLKNKNVRVPESRFKPKIFIAQLGEAGKRKGLVLFENLRKNNIKTNISLDRNSMKSQLRIANRLKVKFTLIVGQKEALDGTVIIRDMESGIQETLPIENIVKALKKKL